jgi:hypothetical protein
VQTETISQNLFQRLNQREMSIVDCSRDH